MKYKKYIIILICSIIIYMLLTFLYKNILTQNDYIQTYVATQDISKGETVSIDKLKCIKVENILDSKLLVKLDDIQNKVANKDIALGQFIKKEDLTNSDEYSIDDEKCEYICIKLETVEQNVSYKIKKGSIVNIYYTTKTSQIKDSLDSYEESISSSLSDLYTTVSFLSNVKIIDTMNKSGISTEALDNNSIDNLTNAVIIKVTKDIAMKINNLKNYGTFSCTLVE